jgi:hypothetical protein
MTSIASSTSTTYRPSQSSDFKANIYWPDLFGASFSRQSLIEERERSARVLDALIGGLDGPSLKHKASLKKLHQIKDSVFILEVAAASYHLQNRAEKEVPGGRYLDAFCLHFSKAFDELKRTYEFFTHSQLPNSLHFPSGRLDYLMTTFARLMTMPENSFHSCGYILVQYLLRYEMRCTYLSSEVRELVSSVLFKLYQHFCQSPPEGHNPTSDPRLDIFFHLDLMLRPDHILTPYDREVAILKALIWPVRQRRQDYNCFQIASWTALVDNYPHKAYELFKTHLQQGDLRVLGCERISFYELLDVTAYGDELEKMPCFLQLSHYLGPIPSGPTGKHKLSDHLLMRLPPRQAQQALGFLSARIEPALLAFQITCIDYQYKNNAIRAPRAEEEFKNVFVGALANSLLQSCINHKDILDEHVLFKELQSSFSSVDNPGILLTVKESELYVLGRRLPAFYNWRYIKQKLESGVFLVEKKGEYLLRIRTLDELNESLLSRVIPKCLKSESKKACENLLATLKASLEGPVFHHRWLIAVRAHLHLSVSEILGTRVLLFRNKGGYAEEVVQKVFRLRICPTSSRVNNALAYLQTLKKIEQQAKTSILSLHPFFGQTLAHCYTIRYFPAELSCEAQTRSIQSIVLNKIIKPAHRFLRTLMPLHLQMEALQIIWPTDYLNFMHLCQLDISYGQFRERLYQAAPPLFNIEQKINGLFNWLSPKQVNFYKLLTALKLRFSKGDLKVIRYRWLSSQKGSCSISLCAKKISDICTYVLNQSVLASQVDRKLRFILDRPAMIECGEFNYRQNNTSLEEPSFTHSAVSFNYYTDQLDFFTQSDSGIDTRRLSSRGAILVLSQIDTLEESSVKELTLE